MKKNPQDFSEDEIETLKLLAGALQKGYQLKIVQPNGEDGLMAIQWYSDHILDPESYKNK